MPELKTYGVFVSHAWEHHEDYDRVVKILNDAALFFWKNYSVPEHDPLGARTDAKLEEALRRQIRPTHVVIILSGMYAAYSKWIKKEIDIALEMGKPVIGVKPWGHERVPTAVQDVVKEIVGWNTASIVSAIRKHAL